MQDLPPLTGDRETLLRHRVVLVSGPIDDDTAKDAIARLLFLEDASQSEPVLVVIDSPGGSAIAGLAIADMMRDVKSPLRTICRGEAGGVAVVLLLTAKAGSRMLAEGCRLTLAPSTPAHAIPPVGRARRELLDRLASLSGRTRGEIEEAMASPAAWPADQALAFGIGDAMVPGEAGPK